MTSKTKFVQRQLLLLTNSELFMDSFILASLIYKVLTQLTWRDTEGLASGETKTELTILSQRSRFCVSSLLKPSYINLRGALILKTTGEVENDVTAARRGRK